MSWENPGPQLLVLLLIMGAGMISLFSLATVIADIRRHLASRLARRRMLKLWRKQGWIR